MKCCIAILLIHLTLVTLEKYKHQEWKNTFSYSHSTVSYLSLIHISYNYYKTAQINSKGKQVISLSLIHICPIVLGPTVQLHNIPRSLCNLLMLLKRSILFLLQFLYCKLLTNWLSGYLMCRMRKLSLFFKHKNCGRIVIRLYLMLWKLVSVNSCGI